MAPDEYQEPEKPYHELVTQIQSRLYAFISTLMAGNSDASDVLQETNVVLWEKASAYDKCSSFSAWAYRIAQFQVLAYRERQSRGRRLVFSDELVSTLADDFENGDSGLEDSLAALKNCISRLTEANRSLIRQRYQEGLAVSELATASGQQAGTVAVSLHRIRKTLLRCLERTLGKEGVL